MKKFAISVKNWLFFLLVSIGAFAIDQVKLVTILFLVILMFLFVVFTFIALLIGWPAYKFLAALRSLKQ